MRILRSESSCTPREGKALGFNSVVERWADLLLLTLLLFLLLTACQPKVETGNLGMVSSQHPRASEVGLSILKAGGNAIDAAVATAFAIGVVEPYHSGIGGGSFIVIRSAASGDVVAIDAREKAPMASTRDMYQRDGEVVGGLSSIGPLAVGVPGTVAGLTLALARYGTMTLEEVIEPSIEIAENGVKIDPFFHNVLSEKVDLLMRFPHTGSIYLSSGVRPYPEGYNLIQNDLADMYRKIAVGGSLAFYHGDIARQIADYMKEVGGIITLEDLKAYVPVVREAVRGDYRGHEIVSMPPPSSGGIHLIQILNILEGFEVTGSGPDDPEYLHRLAGAMALAFEDRARLLGDADFVDVPVERLLSKEYAGELRGRIETGMINAVDIEDDAQNEGGGTSHLCVIDSAGNVVSLTQTINLWFGSGVTIPGMGLILNNEMDDFSAMPGVPNEFGLVGSEANAIEPDKRPLSSMSPTIVLKEDKPFLILGSRGGPRIITSVLQVILNVIDFNMKLDEAIEAPRIHHQWVPDILYVEEGVPENKRKELEDMGYSIEIKEDGIGCVTGIFVSDYNNLIYGDSDPRGIGGARGY
jgi:gamma-glutamyltranspeptidase/glutathione hydrolase